MNARQTITLKFNSEKEEYANKLFDYLQEQFDNGYFDMDGDGQDWEITISESGNAGCYKGVMYTKNGDGYPDEYWDDFEIYEDDVKEMSEAFADNLMEELDAEYEVLWNFIVYTEYDYLEGYYE